MVILELQPLGFGKFSGEKFSFSRGLHVIYGENESGKTTLQWFIVGMLYGFFQPGTKRKTYEPEHGKYQPWNTAAPYAGVMVCEKDGSKYRIERVFQKDMDLVTVYNHQTGEDITAAFPYNPVTRLYEPGETLTGMSKTIFCNTLCISQGQCPFHPGLGKAVQEHMTAMVQTGDGQYSLGQALNLLEKQQEEVGTPKKSKSPYGAAVQKIQLLEEQLYRAQEKEEEYFALLRQQQEKKAELKEQEKEVEMLQKKQSQQKQQREKQRYLKVCQLREQCQKLQKEQESLAPISQITPKELEEIYWAQGGNGQNTALLQQYSRQQEQLWENYSQLGFACTQRELLEQFDAYAAKYRQAAEKQGVVNRSKEMEANLTEVLAKTHVLNSQGLEEDISQYKYLSSKGKPVVPVLLLLLAVVLGTAGAMRLLPQEIKWGLWGLAAAVAAAAALAIKGIAAKPKTTQRQADILGKYSVESLAQLEELLSKVELNNYKYQQFQEQLSQAKEQIRQGKEEVYQLLRQVWVYVRELTGEEDADPGAVVSKEMAGRVAQGKELLGKIQLLEEQKHQLEQAAGQPGQERARALLNQYQAVSVEEIKEKQQRFQQIALELQLNQKLLAEMLEGTTIEELQTMAAACQASSEETPENEKYLANQLEEAAEKKQELLQQLAQKEGHRKAMEKEFCPPGEILEQIREFQLECQRFQQETEAITLAKQRLQQASLKIQQDFAPALSRKVSLGLPGLTAGKYDKMLVTPELGLRLVDQKSGRLVEVSQLSQGAQDLLYFMARIHLGKILAKEGAPPLLLDDVFAQIDQTRMERLLRHLGGEEQGQTLLFTCHQREALFLKGLDVHWKFTRLPA